MEPLKKRLYSLLRATERYTKTDMVYLASGGFWLTAGYGAQVLMGLVLTVAFANFLPKDIYGTYQFVISMAAIVGVLTLTGMGTAVMRAAARGSKGVLRYGVRTQLAWSSGIAMASLILALYYAVNENAVLFLSFCIVALTQPFISGFGIYKWYLHGKRQFREGAVIETVQRLLPFSAMLCAIVLFNDALIIIAAYFVSNALALFGAYRYAVWKHREPIRSDPELTRYSKHLSVMESLAEIASNIDKVLIWTFLGAAPVAAYALAQLPVMHLHSIFGFIRSLAFPKIAAKSLPELQRELPSRMRIYSLAAAIGTGVFILAAPLLFSLLFPEYPESILYAQVLALSVLAVPRSLIAQAFAAHQLTKELYIVNVSVPVIRILLLFALLPLFGVWGAIAATLATELYAALLQLSLFRRASTVP